jgi:hypothetical protein
MLSHAYQRFELTFLWAKTERKKPPKTNTNRRLCNITARQIALKPPLDFHSPRQHSEAMNKAPVLEVWLGDRCQKIDPEAIATSAQKWETGNDCIDHILNEGLFKRLLESHELPKIRDYWRERLIAATQNPPKTPEVSTAFHTQWHVCHHYLRQLVDDDDLLLDLIWVWLPRYQGSELTLYRGENIDRFESGKLGSAWSNKQETAKMFARELNNVSKGGVILRATVPSSLIIAGPSEHSFKMNECEFSVDTRKLTGIVKVEIFPSGR